MKKVKTLHVQTRSDWRDWLRKNHDKESGIWLVFNKRHTGRASLSYNDVVEEALCFGWIDSLIRRLDDGRYARKVTPRKADSRWSTANRLRYAALQARGLLAPAGRRRPPTALSGDAPRPSISMVPPHIERAFKARPSAWRFFEQLAPSYRRRYIGWIESAKKPATRKRRIREVVGLLAAGKKPGLK